MSVNFGTSQAFKQHRAVPCVGTVIEATENVYTFLIKHKNYWNLGNRYSKVYPVYWDAPINSGYKNTATGA
jgi:hypothetical protein